MFLTVPPTPPAQIIVVNVDDRSTYILTGFKAFGSAAEPDTLETAAKAAGLPAVRAAAAKSQYYARPSTMVVFRPGSDMDAARNFYHRVRKGEFGALDVEVLVITPAKANDSDGIKSAELEVWDADDAQEQ
jgi:hypothetical protein